MSLLTAAVHNNAVWCDTVCRALGCDTAWADGLWVNRSPAPPYYSNAVTTDPDRTAAQREGVRRMLESPLPRPWTIKDGFSALDLSPMGFEILFAAQWIAAPAAHRFVGAPAAGLSWTAAADDLELGAWERAWQDANDTPVPGDRLFRPSLLADPDMRFVAGWEDDRIVAVAAANRSDDGSGPVVGVSNIVLRGAGAERHRGGMMAAVQDVYPGLPLVGYERGDDLTAMTALGFRPTGALRVWIAPAPAA